MTAPPPRMRIERGRVMHQVTARADHFESVCRKRHPVLKDRTEPRARGHKSFWTAENLLGYPNCTHCPTD